MNMNHKSIKLAVAGVALILLGANLSSCGVRDENTPGVEFMPDMYRSPSVENYGTHVLEGDTLQSAMLPVKGTIARGYMPYTYENSTAGYEAAGANLKSPLDMSLRAKHEAEGEQIYGKFCIHCHGATGAGDGKVGLKLPGPPPAYDGALKDLPEGKIFHSISYGKNSMGAHNNLLSTEERWKLVCYVQKLQGKKEASDSTKVAAVATPTMAAAHGAETHGK